MALHSTLPRKGFTAARDRTGLTSINPATIQTWNARRGPEIRYCESTDGAWSYTRIEDGSTTWVVRHLPSGRALDFEPSLPVARQGTASGWTLAELDRQDARVAS